MSYPQPVPHLPAPAHSQSPLSPPSELKLHHHHRSPPQPSPPVVHKRNYQACIPCRQRKVRCDLGSVEAPHDPPCVRCRRESKECYFSATRRKRAPSADVPPGMGRGRVRRHDDSPGLTNGAGGGDLKRARTAEQPGYSPTPYRPSAAPQHGQPIDPRLENHSRHQLPPLAPPPPPPQANTTDTLLQTEVYNSHEALLTLIEAAGKDTPLSTGPKSDVDSPTTDGGESARDLHSRKDSAGNRSHIHSPAPLPGPGRWNQSVHFSSTQSDEGVGAPSSSSSHTYRKSTISSLVSPKGQAPRGQSVSTTAQDDGMEKALRAWNKFRFVKAGWFTAREAVGFVDYFYRHLHPLSPTLTSPTLLHVSHPRYHPLLLRYEPFLTTTILTVASRYMTLPGPGGHSRSYAIHDMLWREVRGGFERLMWGGGWGGIVPRQTGLGNPLNSANGAKVGRGLRTLGTVEGLLILTEWHVRGLHFPMDVEESDWGVDVSDDEDDLAAPKSADRAKVVEGQGDRIENILEPAYRSDRMSWMLLGNALALAYELGVFDDVDDSTPPPTSNPPTPREPGEVPFRTRAQRIQKLLVVYVLHLASRLGWTSMIPRQISSTRDKLAPPGAAPGGTWASDDELQDVVFSSWVDLTLLMKNSSDLLFPSRAITKNIMRTGHYVALLEHFQPRLRAWKRDFDALRLPPPICHILVMEYEHVRFYVNSLALQAVVDRCSLRSPALNPSQQSFTALWEMSPQDAAFIKEVVDAARSLLSTVVKDMFPHGYLKHAPVRIYLRILSAAMFLLKTFALGAKEEDVKLSMDLIDSAVQCLRAAAVDDVSLGLRFAELLGSLAGRVRGRFVRMPRSRGGTPVPVEVEERKVGPGRGGGGGGDRDEEMNGGGGGGGGDGGGSGGGGGNGGCPATGGVGGYSVQQQDEMQGGYEQMSGQWAGGYEDWLALPLDPIVGFEGVTQGTMGVDVGGVDLLEVLLAGGQPGVQAHHA